MSPSVVDFPQPLGPSSVTNSPSAMSRSMPSTATTLPNFLPSLLSRSAMSATRSFPIDEVSQSAEAFDRDDQHERNDHRQDGHGGERRRETELEKAEDLDADRHLSGARYEQRHVHVGERMDEREHCAGEDAVLDQGEYHLEQNGDGRSAQAGRRLLDVGGKAIEADGDRAHAERKANHEMTRQERPEPHVVAKPYEVEELQKPYADDERRQHQRTERKRDERVASFEPIARQSECQRQGYDRADERRANRQAKAEQDRVDPVVRKRVRPPL